MFTVNSKAGVEALITGLPVICLDDSYYLSEGLAVSVENFKRKGLEYNKPNIDNINSFLKNLKQRSFPCELYQNEPENIELFCKALNTAIQEGRYLNVS